MGNKQGAKTRELLYGPGFHKEAGRRGGKALWRRIKKNNPAIIRSKGK